jgi:hypothetical protein
VQHIEQTGQIFAGPVEMLGRLRLHNSTPSRRISCISDLRSS